MTRLGGKAGVAAPITVAGELWGALGAAYDEDLIPAGIEARLERFASLVGLAISNADAWDKLARQASTDPLTGIANRRTFHERLTAEVARAHRYGRHLSLVVIDLDDFKALNDLHGHPAGDRVLVLFAQLLNARSSENAPDADTLIRDTDRALYWAKDSGRNMTLLYTDEARATLSKDQTTDRVTTAPSPEAARADQTEPPTDASPTNTPTDASPTNTSQWPLLSKGRVVDRASAKRFGAPRRGGSRRAQVRARRCR